MYLLQRPICVHSVGDHLVDDCQQVVGVWERPGRVTLWYAGCRQWSRRVNVDVNPAPGGTVRRLVRNARYAPAPAATGSRPGREPTGPAWRHTPRGRVSRSAPHSPTTHPQSTRNPPAIHPQSTRNPPAIHPQSTRHPPAPPNRSACRITDGALSEDEPRPPRLRGSVIIVMDRLRICQNFREYVNCYPRQLVGTE